MNINIDNIQKHRINKHAKKDYITVSKVDRKIKASFPFSILYSQLLINYFHLVPYSNNYTPRKYLQAYDFHQDKKETHRVQPIFIPLHWQTLQIIPNSANCEVVVERGFFYETPRPLTHLPLLESKGSSW